MSKTIREIKEELERASGDERRALCALYEQDKRTGVQKLLISYRKQELAKEQELLRLEGMCTYEKKYRSYDRICGIDEVGRGPLAGPVVAAAVILPKDCRILYANDSKKLSAKLWEWRVHRESMKSIFSRRRMRPCGRPSENFPRLRICS